MANVTKQSGPDIEHEINFPRWSAWSAVASTACGCDELHHCLQTKRAKLSRSSPVAEPIDYMLTRWNGFVSFLDHGQICLTNNAVERALALLSGEVMALRRIGSRR
ncbi:hypothetical protein J2W52_005165 [Rhizobium miluonense]|uniref:Transposase IS66 central domain-containing protein n=1 Tax=Rhizobium miluonense TaxID=411945 RepID=A0ABU1SX31_9HYPH|nr:hypothetical protein [Rhizobium miluonense]